MLLLVLVYRIITVFVKSLPLLYSLGHIALDYRMRHRFDPGIDLNLYCVMLHWFDPSVRQRIYQFVEIMGNSGSQ